MDEQKNITDNQDMVNTSSNREAELENQLKRALADYANLKNRLEKEKSEMTKFSNEILLMRMIGILDGLEMTSREFRNLLEQNGFTKENVNVGDKFDPNKMEAIDINQQGEYVIEVYAPAYRLHDKIVRAAQVKIGQKKEETTHA